MFKLNHLVIPFVYFFSCSSFALESSKPVAFPVDPFTAKYNILHKGDPVGKAVRELSYLENGHINYSYNTEIEWLIFSDNRKESSILKPNPETNIITPVSYLFERTGTGKDKHRQWTFVPKDNQGTCVDEDDDKHKMTLDFSMPLQDKLSYHLQQRINLITNPQQKHFVYPVIQNSGKTKNYVYEFDGEEEIMLPYGSLKTIRLKREVIEKKKITYAWFAPELNYLLVKLHQTKAGVNQFEAQLNSYQTDKN